MPVTMTFTIDAADVNSPNPKVHDSPWGGPGKMRKTVEVATMQQVAAYTPAWNVYQGLSAQEREVFKFALDAPSGLVRTVEDVKRFARQMAAPPPPAMPLNVPKPDPIYGSVNDAFAFRQWLANQAARMDGFETYLKFVLGDAYALNGGTISVPIHIAREGARANATGFVFHYHPDASGPGVGHAYASTGHFKPDDHKKIRVYKHDVEGNPRLNDLWNAARQKARRL